jgi:hypothetical protein
MRETFLLLADRRRNDFRNFGMTPFRLNWGLLNVKDFVVSRQNNVGYVTREISTDRKH